MRSLIPSCFARLLAAALSLGVALPAARADSDADLLRAWQERFIFITGVPWQFPNWDDPAVAGTSNPAPVMPGDDYAATDSGAYALVQIIQHTRKAGYTVNYWDEYTPSSSCYYLPDFYLSTADIDGLTWSGLMSLRVSEEVKLTVAQAKANLYVPDTASKQWLAGVMRKMKLGIRPATLTEAYRRAWYDQDWGYLGYEVLNPPPPANLNTFYPQTFRIDPAGFQESPPATYQTSVSFYNGRVVAHQTCSTAAAPHFVQASWTFFGKANASGPAFGPGGALRQWYEDNVASLSVPGAYRRLKKEKLEWPAPGTLYGTINYSLSSAGIGELANPTALGSGGPGSTIQAPHAALSNAPLAIGAASFRYLPSVSDCGCASCTPGTFNAGSEGPAGSISAGLAQPDGTQPRLEFDFTDSPPGAALDWSPDVLKLPHGYGGAAVVARAPAEGKQVVSGDSVTHVSSAPDGSIVVRTARKSIAGTPEPDGWFPDLVTLPLGSIEAKHTLRKLSNPERIVVETDRGIHTESVTWTRDGATGAWVKTGTRIRAEEPRLQTFPYTGPALRAEAFTKTDYIGDTPASGIASKRSTQRALLPGGWKTTSETVDPDGVSPLTTSYAYYTDQADVARRNRLQTLSRPDGSWDRFEYDDRGRTARQLSSWLDTPQDAPESALRIREFYHYDYPVGATTGNLTYTPVAGGGAYPATAVETREILLGSPVARSLRLEWTEGTGSSAIAVTAEVTATVLSASADAQFRSGSTFKDIATLRSEGNLVSLSRSYDSGPLAGRPVSSQAADGTLTLYSYVTTPAGADWRDAQTIETTTETGAPNAAGTAIVDGTRSITLVDRRGTTLAETTEDIASGKTLSSRTATSVDDYGRVLTWTYDDATTETMVYDCCGLASSTDRTGLVTTYPVRDEKVNGGIESSTSSPLRWTDPAGTVQDGFLTLVSRDEGNTQISRRVGADGTTIELSRTVSDVAGRMISSRDAAGRETTYSETLVPIGAAPAPGAPDLRPRHRIRTTTAPDGGTSIEESSADGRILKLSGTAVHAVRYEYGVSSPGAGQPALPFTKTIRLLADQTTDSQEWTQSWVDAAGRPLSTLSSSGAQSWTYYDAAGRVSRTVDGDGVQTLRAYDARGRLQDTAVDMDRDGVIDYDGTDRIARSTSSVVTDPVRGDVIRSITSAWNVAGQDTPVVLSVQDASFTGRQSWATSDGLTAHQQTALQGSGNWTQTATAPDLSSTITTYLSGRAVSAEARDANGVVLATSTTHYDAHGRAFRSVDGRNGATTTIFNADDRPQSITTPVPGDLNGNPAQTTTFTYDAAGRTWQVTLPDHTPAAPQVVTTTYFPTGQVQETSGARTYRSAYTYDHAGRPATLTTWQNPATPAVTTWDYEPATGRLHQKRDAANAGPVFTYTPGGRLQSRTAARQVNGDPLTTTYGYDNGGTLTDVLYSDATPDVHYTPDRMGRVAGITDAAGQHTIARSPAGRFEGETITAAAGSASHLAGASFTPGYDALERRSSFTAALGTATVTQGYGYDAASRLSSAEQGNVRATYARHPLSPLIGSITFTDTAAGNAQRLVETRVHDHLDRLQSITAANAAGFARGFSYRLNAAGQRERVDETGGAAWAWQYDALGQLTSASREQITDSSGTTSAPVPGEQFGYTYDGIGNRLASSRGDTPDSATHAEQAAYTPNLLNQYTSRTHPGAVNVSGTARTSATVTVNGQTTTRTPVEGGTGILPVDPPMLEMGPRALFHTRLTADNTTSPALFDATILATEGSTTEQETRRALVPPATETYLHDADGNLTQDALWTYTWDAENRLTQMESRADLPAGTVRQRLAFAYDAGGRRIRKTVHTALPGTDPVQWVLTTDRRFLYDGWNLIAEIDPDGTAYRTYLWGLDLSGTPQGAGGTHGLLAVFLRPASAVGPGPQPAPEAHLCVYDGNGNLSSLVAAAAIPAANGQPAIAAGSETARYTYDPFGSPLSATGPAALRNAIGFSTRYRDEESGLLYYGYRYYDPADGRWLNKDPIAEEGGLNLYGMVGNDPVSLVDVLGLDYVEDFSGASISIRANGRRIETLLRRLQDTKYDPPCQARELDLGELHKEIASLGSSLHEARGALISEANEAGGVLGRYVVGIVHAKPSPTSLIGYYEGHDMLMQLANAGLVSPSVAQAHGGQHLAFENAITELNLVNAEVNIAGMMAMQSLIVGATADLGPLLAIVRSGLNSVKTVCGISCRISCGLASGRGLIGMVKAAGTIKPQMLNSYVKIAEGGAFYRKVKLYNILAWLLRQKRIGNVNEIISALKSDTTFAATSNFRAGLFTAGGHTATTRFWLQGNPATCYGARVGAHELLHLGAAIRGQADTVLHELAVQAASTPENLIFIGSLLYVTAKSLWDTIPLIKDGIDLIRND